MGHLIYFPHYLEIVCSSDAFCKSKWYKAKMKFPLIYTSKYLCILRQTNLLSQTKQKMI